MTVHDKTPAHLIGPRLYRPYVATLKVALLGVAAAAVVVGLSRLAGPDAGLLAPLLLAARVWAQGGFIAFGVVTLLFALVQRSPAATARAERRWARLRRRIA